MRRIEFQELQDNFSSSYNDGKEYENAAKRIMFFLGEKPDGNMLNLNTFPILLANVMDVYQRDKIHLYQVYTNHKRKEYVLKMYVEY